MTLAGEISHIDQAIHDFQGFGKREASFRWIYDRYLGAVRSLFRRRGFLPEKCDELTQETFFRIYKGLEAYDHQGTFSTWLFAVAENVARHERRRHATQKRAGEIESFSESGQTDPDRVHRPPQASSPARQEEELQRQERKQALRREVSRLPPRQRQCLQLFLLDRSYEEIATVLQISRETVKQHLGAARKTLRGQLMDLHLGDTGGSDAKRVGSENSS